MVLPMLISETVVLDFHRGEKDFQFWMLCWIFKQSMVASSEPVFVNLLRSPGIDTQPDGGINFWGP